MENRPQIDHLFKERLYSREVSPPDQVWAGIASALQEKRRKRRILIWMWTGVALSATGLLVLWLAYANLSSTDVPAHPLDGSVRERAVSSDEYASLSEEYAPDESEAAFEPESNSGGAATTTAARKTKAVQATGYTTDKAALKPLPTERPEPGFRQDQVTSLENTALADLGLAPVEVPLRALATELPSLTIKPRRYPTRSRKPINYCYPFEEKSPIWMVDAYVGPSLVQKDLSARDASAEDLLESRQNTESKDWAFNAGVRGSVLLGRHFLVRSGFHYEQFVEKFEYVNPNSIIYLIEQTTEIVDGKPVPILDTLDVIYGDKVAQTYNRFGMLDVPLEAGIEIRGRRSGLSIHGGASLNLLFWQSGDMMQADGDPGAISDTSPSAFRSSVGLSVGGSVQWFYHLEPRTRLFVEPYYRRILKPVSGGDYPLEQRYNFAGLRLGITRVLF